MTWEEKKAELEKLNWSEGKIAKYKAIFEGSRERRDTSDVTTLGPGALTSDVKRYQKQYGLTDEQALAHQESIEGNVERAKDLETEEQFKAHVEDVGRATEEAMKPRNLAAGAGASLLGLLLGHGAGKVLAPVTRKVTTEVLKPVARIGAEMIGDVVAGYGSGASEELLKGRGLKEAHEAGKDVASVAPVYGAAVRASGRLAGKGAKGIEESQTQTGVDIRALKRFDMEPMPVPGVPVTNPLSKKYGVNTTPEGAGTVANVGMRKLEKEISTQEKEGSTRFAEVTIPDAYKKAGNNKVPTDSLVKTIEQMEASDLAKNNRPIADALARAKKKFTENSEIVGEDPGTKAPIRRSFMPAKDINEYRRELDQMGKAANRAAGLDVDKKTDPFNRLANIIRKDLLPEHAPEIADANAARSAQRRQFKTTRRLMKEPEAMEDGRPISRSGGEALASSVSGMGDSSSRGAGVRSVRLGEMAEPVTAEQAAKMRPEQREVREMAKLEGLKYQFPASRRMSPQDVGDLLMSPQAIEAQRRMQVLQSIEGGGGPRAMLQRNISLLEPMVARGLYPALRSYGELSRIPGIGGALAGLLRLEQPESLREEER